MGEKSAAINYESYAEPDEPLEWQSKVEKSVFDEFLINYCVTVTNIT